jgi:hypothetical protein
MERVKRPIDILEDNIKMDFKFQGCEFGKTVTK